MKKYHILAAFLIGLFLLPSCDSFLNDRDSPNKILFENYFKDEKDLKLYANRLLNDGVPSAASITRGNDEYADNVAVSSRTSFLQANFSPDNQGGWTTSTWSSLYSVNIFLTYMDRAAGNVDEATMNHYEGIGRFWRAMFYYNMVKQFGDVPWYDYPIEPDDLESLYKTRDRREYVMHKVLEDLNFASEYISSDVTTNKGGINRYVALAMKSRICLYEGTYRKYHSENYSSGTPWSTEYESSADFLNECVKACEELLNNSPFAIASGANAQTFYRSLFTSDLNETEVIWGRYFVEDVVMHDATLYFNQTGNQTHRWSPTKEFVDTYLRLDGTPYTSSVGYDTKMFMDEFENRDYRMMQTIMPPHFVKVKAGSVVPWAPNLAITYTGYQIIKFNLDDDAYETVGNSTNDLPIIRMGEIALNYAEAMWELGKFDEGVWNRTIKPLRERAGVNGTMPTTADPYMVQYYNNKVTDAQLLEIRRERAIELFFEGVRYDDLMRWKMGELIEKTWTSMVILEKNTVYDMGQNGATLFALVDSAPATTQEGVYYLNLALQSNVYTYTAEKKLRVNNSDIVWEDKKYLRPVPSVALVINPDLGQNKYWQN